MPELLALCRAGFEPECVQELEQALTEREGSGYARTERDSGFVRLTWQGPDTAGQLDSDQLTFTRLLWPIVQEMKNLDPKDRAAPMLEWLEATGLKLGDLRVECADSQAGESLRALCRGFESAMLGLLRQRKIIDKHAKYGLIVFFVSTDHALLGFDKVDLIKNQARGGIVRLRFPSEAPSRSTLKLEEAFQVLLTDAERERWLQPGMSAVDLGACPGGWTYQFVRRSMRVVAVDNGQMAPSLMDSGLVEHIRADGFAFRPKKPADWLVCDMVEQPIRVAALVGDWLGAGQCQRSIFNLKLPMKKRYAEVLACIETLRERAGGDLLVRSKQLYHDREEITVLATRPLRQS